MPNRNATGPLGEGPKTGRGLGPCGSGQANGRNEDSDHPRKGLFGRGRRQGRGLGLGLGRRNQGR